MASRKVTASRDVDMPEENHPSSASQLRNLTVLLTTNKLNIKKKKKKLFCPPQGKHACKLQHYLTAHPSQALESGSDNTEFNNNLPPCISFSIIKSQNFYKVGDLVY